MAKFRRGGTTTPSSGGMPSNVGSMFTELRGLWGPGNDFSGVTGGFPNVGGRDDQFSQAQRAGGLRSYLESKKPPGYGNVTQIGGGGYKNGYGADPNAITGWLGTMLKGKGDAPEFQYDAPAAWNPDAVEAGKNPINPMSVIQAQLPWLKEQRELGFGEAAARFGQGGIDSSAYQNALGDVSRRSMQDLDRVAMDTLFKAGSEQAQLEQQTRQNALDRSLSGWQTHAGFQHEGQLKQADLEMEKWAEENNIDLAWFREMMPFLSAMGIGGFGGMGGGGNGGDSFNGYLVKPTVAQQLSSGRLSGR